MGYDAFICALHSTAEWGKHNWFNANYKYPWNFALLAKHCNIPHFVIVTNQLADAKDEDFYLSHLGKIEEEIKNLKLNSMAVFKPAHMTFGIGKYFNHFGNYLLL